MHHIYIKIFASNTIHMCNSAIELHKLSEGDSTGLQLSYTVHIILT